MTLSLINDGTMDVAITMCSMAGCKRVQLLERHLDKPCTKRPRAPKGKKWNALGELVINQTTFEPRKTPQHFGACSLNLKDIPKDLCDTLKYIKVKTKTDGLFEYVYRQLDSRTKQPRWYSVNLKSYQTGKTVRSGSFHDHDVAGLVVAASKLDVSIKDTMGGVKWIHKMLTDEAERLAWIQRHTIEELD